MQTLQDQNAALTQSEKEVHCCCICCLLVKLPLPLQAAPVTTLRQCCGRAMPRLRPAMQCGHAVHQQEDASDTRWHPSPCNCFQPCPAPPSRVPLLPQARDTPEPAWPKPPRSCPRPGTHWSTLMQWRCTLPRPPSRRSLTHEAYSPQYLRHSL